jgi:hypothetical protein
VQITTNNALTHRPVPNTRGKKGRAKIPTKKQIECSVVGLLRLYDDGKSPRTVPKLLIERRGNNVKISFDGGNTFASHQLDALQLFCKRAREHGEAYVNFKNGLYTRAIHLEPLLKVVRMN